MLSKKGKGSTEVSKQPPVNMLTLRNSSTSIQEKMMKFGLVDSPATSNEQGNGEIEVGAPAPLIISYNNRIRPLLDAVDRLRQLRVMEEGIQLPTIVVVGDQSSGKSSVLESLAGISLPRGQGICTRVPLVMRLQNHSNPEPDMHLEFQGKIVKTSEDHITDSINSATEEIAGSGKGISNIPLTLVVKKRGVPDLTMVDLPGITRVPVHGQPEDIYEQISTTIMEYITPNESIILNVLSATVDFTTCESIRMSQRVDKTGERTLAVVTKADKAPEGLLEKVTNDDVNIGLGYVCVRNRVGEESYDDARIEEARLFNSHPLLSKIDKSIVGIPLLAKKLVEIQATSIGKCLPDIVKKINSKLNDYLSEREKLPKNLTSVGEALTAFMMILGSAKDSLRKLLLRGEFDEFSDITEMHCTARLKEKLDDFVEKLKKESADNDYSSSRLFLMDEIRVLEEAKGIGLPNFLSRTAFLTVLQKKVKGVAYTPVEFVSEIWCYIEQVVVKVLSEKCSVYPQLHNPVQRAAQNLMIKVRERSIDRIKEFVEMENVADYTSNPEYMNAWNLLMGNQKKLMEVINDSSQPTKLMIAGFGEVEVGHLRQYSSLAEEAFDMKMRLTAYWKIVIMRMVDFLAKYIIFSVQKLIDKELEGDIMNEVVGPHLGGLERMLQESPSLTVKRDRLNRSVQLLRESKDVVANIMDRFSADNN